MTVPFDGDLYQAVLPGGTVTLTQMFETSMGSFQPQPVSNATIAIAAASGAGSPVLAATSVGLTTPDRASYSYTWLCPASIEPGDYTVTFTATGQAGQITYTQGVTVAGQPDASPLPGVYATVGQYQDQTGDQWTPVPRVQSTLRRASQVIDRAMMCAWYPVDANGMPTRAGDMIAFAEATCAQAEFMLGMNDPANVKSQFSTTNVGGVTTTRTASAQGQIFPPLAPAAAMILQGVGALTGAPMLGW